MSLVDVDSWLTEFEACDRLQHFLLTQLTLRDKKQKLSPEYNRLTAGIQVGLKQFQTEARALKLRLDAATKSRSITFEENERRQRQVDTLQSQLQQLESQFTRVTRSDRAAMLNDDETTSTQSPWQSATTSSTLPVIDNSDVDMLKQRQIEILEDQNRGLESLSQTISRQRALASQFGQEVEDQNGILDNLANTMERVDSRVNVETGNIVLVSRQDSTWTYWIVIIVLFIAIIIVALI